MLLSPRAQNFVDCHVWFLPGLSASVEANTLGFFSLHRETKFIIGFDFALTLLSLASLCVLFDITSRQMVELKWRILNTQKMIPFITCEISLGLHVCQLVLGVEVSDQDFGVQVDSLEHPIKCNSVGYVSLSGFFP